MIPPQVFLLFMEKRMTEARREVSSAAGHGRWGRRSVPRGQTKSSEYYNRRNLILEENEMNLNINKWELTPVTRREGIYELF